MKKYQIQLLFFICLLPAIIIAGYYFFAVCELDSHNENLNTLEERLLMESQLQRKNIAVHRFHKNSDPHYLDNVMIKGSLIEEMGVSFPFFKEAELSLLKPIVVDANEIEKIIVALENPQRGAPQLLIETFEAERFQALGQRDQFSVNLKLLKREFGS